MTHLAKDVLDRIDRFLADPEIMSSAKQDLWDVLTALRGPDDPDEEYAKGRTTVPIRRAAFPLAAAAVDRRDISAPAAFCKGETNTIKRTDLPHKTQHFAYHIRDAARTLGIWDSSDEVPQ